MSLRDLPYFPAFRPRADAGARIASALSAVRCILAGNILRLHKKELLSVCLWKISEAEGSNKYDTRFVSASSLQHAQADLAHEHVHERAKLIRGLLDGSISINTLRDRAFACTVTREEHEVLGAVDTSLEGWERYSAARVAVIDRTSAAWVIPPCLDPN